jgi:hypothetical protein
MLTKKERKKERKKDPFKQNYEEDNNNKAKGPIYIRFFTYHNQ